MDFKMSSNPFNFDDNYRRDSFSDRICNDLSEVILQFLPIKDKFRLECVSKQFQRTVFQKQYTLALCRTIERRIRSKIIPLKTVLKKLPNLRYLVSGYGINRIQFKDKEIRYIIRYCNHLKAFECDFSRISNKMKDKFVAKFGDKLTSISVKPFKMDSVVNSFPNIQTLNPFGCFGYWMTSAHMRSVQFKRLKTISISIREPPNVLDVRKELIGFKELTESHKRLKHLRLEVMIETEKGVEFLFDQISNLDQLIDLKIVFNPIGILDKPLANGFKQLSLKCQKLKSLEVEGIVLEETLKIHPMRFLSQLNRFNHLNRLEMVFLTFPQTTPDFDPFKSINECLKRLNRLTDLRLEFPDNLVVKDSLLTDIDRYLPHLQSMVIGGRLEATEDSAYAVSRLPFLKKIVIHLSDSVDHSILSLFRSKIKEKSKRITKMYIIGLEPSTAELLKDAVSSYLQIHSNDLQINE